MRRERNPFIIYTPDAEAFFDHARDWRGMQIESAGSLNRSVYDKGWPYHRAGSLENATYRCQESEGLRRDGVRPSLWRRAVAARGYDDKIGDEAFLDGIDSVTSVFSGRATSWLDDVAGGDDRRPQDMSRPFGAGILQFVRDCDALPSLFEAYAKAWTDEDGYLFSQDSTSGASKAHDAVAARMREVTQKRYAEAAGRVMDYVDWVNSMNIEVFEDGSSDGKLRVIDPSFVVEAMTFGDDDTRRNLAHDVEVEAMFCGGHSTHDIALGCEMLMRQEPKHARDVADVCFEVLLRDCRRRCAEVNSGYYALSGSDVTSELRDRMVFDLYEWGHGAMECLNVCMYHDPKRLPPVELSGASQMVTSLAMQIDNLRENTRLSKETLDQRIRDLYCASSIDFYEGCKHSLEGCEVTRKGVQSMLSALPEVSDESARRIKHMVATSRVRGDDCYDPRGRYCVYPLEAISLCTDSPDDFVRVENARFRDIPEKLPRYMDALATRLSTLAHAEVPDHGRKSGTRRPNWIPAGDMLARLKDVRSTYVFDDNGFLARPNGAEKHPIEVGANLPAHDGSDDYGIA